MVIIMTILFIRRQYGVLQHRRTARHVAADRAYPDTLRLAPLSRQELANTATQEMSLN